MSGALQTNAKREARCELLPSEDPWSLAHAHSAFNAERFLFRAGLLPLRKKQLSIFLSCTFWPADQLVRITSIGNGSRSGHERRHFDLQEMGSLRRLVSTCVAYINITPCSICLSLPGSLSETESLAHVCKQCAPCVLCASCEFCCYFEYSPPVNIATAMRR